MSSSSTFNMCTRVYLEAREEVVHLVGSSWRSYHHAVDIDGSSSQLSPVPQPGFSGSQVLGPNMLTWPNVLTSLARLGLCC